jgi:hypothetical protein
MNKTQKLRLKALLALDASKLSDTEKQELATLQSTAKAANWNPETDAIEDEGLLSEDDVKGVVVDALKAIGLDADSVKAIRESLKGDGTAPLKVEDITKAIEQHIGGKGIDQAALLAEIKKAIPASKGITADELDAKLTEFAKGLKAPSRMEFNTEDASFPIEHRMGNLTVAQKQLANICLMHVTDEAIANSGIKRPVSMDDGITPEQLKAAARNGDRHCKSVRMEAVYGRKAITAGGAGSGAELVNHDLSSDLLARLYLESALAAEFTAQEINMPSNPFTLPLTTTRPVFKVGSEGAAGTNSDPGTAAPVLTAGKLIGQSSYSYEAEEDAIIAILPMLQESLGAAAADALEGALLNGDTTATHMDSDIHAVSLHSSKLFKGFRKLALAGGITSSFATGGISADNIGALRKKMGKYGVKPRDLIIVAGVKGYNDLVQLDETLTAEKVGSNIARIITGEAPVLFGMRIITSAQVREDLNASGVYDGSTTTKGSLLIVHKPSFLLGVRRGFTVEVETVKREQLNYVVASFRRAFAPKETPSATESMVALGYNFTS